MKLNEFSKEPNAVNTVSSTAWSNSENSDLIDLILNSVNNEPKVWHNAISDINSSVNDFLSSWNEANDHVIKLVSERRLEDTVRKIKHIAFGGESIRNLGGVEKLALGAAMAMLVYNSNYPRIEFPKTSREAMQLSKNIFIDQIKKKDLLCTILYPAKLVYDKIIDMNGSDSVMNRGSDRNDVKRSDTSDKFKNVQKESKMKKSIFSTLSEMYEAKNIAKKPSSDLPSAKSLNDVDNDDNDDLDNDNDSGTDQFKQLAGDMGRDLYSLSQFNFGDFFTPSSENSDAVSAIESAKKLSPRTVKSIDNLLNVSANDISSSRSVVAAILNDRNNTLIAFTAHPDSTDSSCHPTVEQLLQHKLIDRDQAVLLHKLVNAGTKYSIAQLNNDDWEVGGDIDEKTYNAQEKLFDVLKLKELPKKKELTARDIANMKKNMYTPDENDPEYQKMRARIKAEIIAARDKKDNTVRKKR